MPQSAVEAHGITRGSGSLTSWISVGVNGMDKKVGTLVSSEEPLKTTSNDHTVEISTSNSPLRAL